MLEFGQYISFVVLVIVGMITDLHLGGKPMLRLAAALFQILRWNIRIWTLIIENISHSINMGNTCYDWSRLHGPSTHSAFVSL